MIPRHRFSCLIALLAPFLGWSSPAVAGLVLSFDSSSYTINGVGDTTTVQVFVSQTFDSLPVSSGDNELLSASPVGPGNELLSAAVELSFLTAGPATVVSTSDVTGGPAWDSADVLMTPSGGATLIDLGLVSLFGISDLSSPVLLGTFIFTGQSLGVATINVATLLPGPSFITALGDTLDPTNTPTATITVGAAVPEPSGFALMSIGGVLAAGWIRFQAKAAKVIL